jgi:uncharacterized protein YyaL (SSP411 family)
MDKSQPSTNAVSASNLFRLGALLAAGKPDAAEAYTLQAKATLAAFEAEILQYPWLFVSLLTSVVTARLGVRKVCIKRGDERALTEYYTLPRAEARALLLVDDEDKKTAGRETARGEEVEGFGTAGLQSRMEDLKLASKA